MLGCNKQHDHMQNNEIKALFEHSIYIVNHTFNV